MLSKELRDFIEAVSLKLKENLSDYDSEKINFAQMVKLNQKFGELCSEILASSGCQREEKLSKHDKNSLESEFADVLFSFLILSKFMNVDLNKAVTKKMQKIKERFNLD